jgi:hypothetical protein
VNLSNSLTKKDIFGNDLVLDINSVVVHFFPQRHFIHRLAALSAACLSWLGRIWYLSEDVTLSTKQASQHSIICTQYRIYCAGWLARYTTFRIHSSFNFRADSPLYICLTSLCFSLHLCVCSHCIVLRHPPPPPHPPLLSLQRSCSVHMYIQYTHMEYILQHRNKQQIG